VPSLGSGADADAPAALRRRKRVAWWVLLREGVLIGPIGWLGLSFLLYDLRWSDWRAGGAVPRRTSSRALS